jgi:hypothetical protein
MQLTYRHHTGTAYCLDGTMFPECFGHGSCVAAQETTTPPACACREGWLAGPKVNCLQGRAGLDVPAWCSSTLSAHDMPLHSAWCEADADACSGHGTCDTDRASPGCACDAYFYGDDCSSCKPLTTHPHRQHQQLLLHQPHNVTIRPGTVSGVAHALHVSREGHLRQRHLPML